MNLSKEFPAFLLSFLLVAVTANAVSGMTTGTIDASTGLAYGDYYLYSDYGSNDTWARILVKDSQENTLYSHILNLGDTKNFSDIGIYITLDGINALPNGTVLGADVLIGDIEAEWTCTDSDGGEDFYTKGYTSNNYGTTIYTYSWDYCDGDTLYESWCGDDGNIGYGSYYDCPYGCEDGACLMETTTTTTSTTTTTTTTIYTTTTTSVGTSTSTTTSTTTTTIPECDGCVYEGSCVSVGFRAEGSYCALEGEMVTQKPESEACDNSFECTSNYCLDGQCLQEGFFQMLLNWIYMIFASLFGAPAS